MPFGINNALKKIGGSVKVQVDKILQPNRARGATSNKKPHGDTKDDNKAGGGGTIIVGIGAPPIGRGDGSLGLDVDLKNRSDKPGVKLEKVNKEGRWEKLDPIPKRDGKGGIIVEPE